MTVADDMLAEVRSMRVNLDQHERRIRRVEDALDTRATPLWKRTLFRLDGWPSWPVVVDRPAWRPWRRWGTS